MEVVDILPSLEVLAVNLVAFDRCLARRRSLFGTVIPIFSFTVVFMLVAALFFNGAAFNVGEFSALGFLYFFPLRLLYVGRTEDILLSMCMTWTYSLGVLAVSVQAAMLMESFGMAVPVFVLEAVLFLATFFPFGTRLISRFSYILQNACTMQKARSVYFEASIVLNFLTLLVVHVAFADKQEYALQILAVLLILASNYFFYHVVYEIVSGSLRISALELETSIDVLTGLGNRTKAIDDVRALMREEKAFSIVYLDLDRFKTVNDRFGHDMGDRYLRHFAKVFSEALEGKGSLYRIGGDEFVAICHGMLDDRSVSKMAECGSWHAGAPCEFNGVSVGLVACAPPYGDEAWNDAFKRADERMYEDKARKSSSDR